GHFVPYFRRRRQDSGREAAVEEGGLPSAAERSRVVQPSENFASQRTALPASGWKPTDSPRPSASALLPCAARQTWTFRPILWSSSSRQWQAGMTNVH
ncbi:hypothetical protein L9F63_010364, partial [Diploptera punctata]